MHKESIHKYRKPNFFVACTASRKFSGNSDIGIPCCNVCMFEAFRVNILDFPQQWLKAKYECDGTLCSAPVMIRRGKSEVREPTSKSLVGSHVSWFVLGEQRS